MNHQQLNLATVRERLAGLHGRQLWRSLEELVDDEGFEDLLRREFPRQANGWLGPVSRRQFLKVMGASLALAGLTGCAPQPAEKIVPYVDKPEELVPGKPLFFATAMPLGGYAHGLLVESHEGRPTKVEGNPQHPASLGATQTFHQASILSLYDPDRSQTVLDRGQISTWDSFINEMTGYLQTLNGSGGAGLRILTETVTSPTLASQLRALLDKFPEARWHQYEPINMDNLRAGALLAFGREVNTLYRFDQAARILSLDCDFLTTLPGSVRYAREFIERRRVDSGQQEMNRLYVVESTPTITGAMADHRLAARAADVEHFARAIAAGLGVAAAPARSDPGHAEWIAAVVRDLQSSRGSSIVLAGEAQPPVVHALAHAMNVALGNAGKIVNYTAPIEAEPVNQLQSLRTLVDDMAAGKVNTLLIVGGNPVFDAPADFKFGERLSGVALRVHLSLYEDETSELCHWHLPQAHYLESWGDARAFDGTVSIIQPLIAPLYSGRSAHNLIAIMSGDLGTEDYDIVRSHWEGQFGAAGGVPRPEIAPGTFEQAWRIALHDGIIAGTAAAPVGVTIQAELAQAAATVATGDGLELIFRPDPSIWDGRFANNGWLQELPKPLTTLSWDNAALISAATAQRLNLNNEDLVELDFHGGVIPAAIWIQPGHANESVTLHVGYGRTRAGRVGNSTGFNAYLIRTSAVPDFGSGLQIRPTGQRYRLAPVQSHFSLEGRDLLRVGTIEEFLAHPEFAQDQEHAASEPEASEPESGAQHPVPEPPSLYPGYKYEGHAWGMSINLNACIGCNACVVACQAENNIPVVGKESVRRSREMHWLKVDRYYDGNLDNPNTYFQPRPCMHCENAPCEPVCPVGATGHSSEGLNEMTYNRCVGTRYCSNNCPYKVRRFNFLDYTEQDKIPVLELMANPDVTIRARGVMEKCTYCVQRINHGRIEAEKEDRPIRDGEIKTACQEVCPTQAIIFGDINDAKSEVARLKSTPLNYGMLAELGTRPRTSYLARLRNPNPEITTE